MGQWVVTVAGIAILAVLCDIVLPEGQTRKYIKTVIGVVVTLVMIQPLVNFIGGSSIAADGTFGNTFDVEIQQSYLDMVEEKQLQSQLTSVCSMLQARNIDVEVISVDKCARTIVLRSNSSHTTENQTSIDNAFGAYFADYSITIEWK